MIQTNRVEWIDELKGFLILLVCMGHSGILSEFVTITQAFRMVTFFFLSGILFSVRKHPTFKSYLKSKTRFLLLPYFSLSLLFSIIDPHLYDISFFNKHPYIPESLLQYGVSENIQTAKEYVYMNAIRLFVDGSSVFVTGPLWFVLTLYFVCASFGICYYMCNGRRFCLALYGLVCLLIGWTCNIYGVHLPFGLSQSCTASFFFSVGFLLRDFIRNNAERCRTTNLLKGVALLLPLYFYSINKNGALSMHSNALGDNFFFFLVSTLSGILLVTIIFIMLGRLKIKGKWGGYLRNIARNAVIILAVHYYVIRMCRLLPNNIDAWCVFAIMTIVCVLSIPLFRNKLYFLLGKEKISIKESLSIQ